MNEGSETTPAGSPGLFEELRRRKVVRVGLAYVMASWALLQVVDVVAPILRVPDATVEILFWLLVAGFPIAVFLSWAYELTRTVSVPPAERGASSARPSTKKGFSGAVIALPM